MYRWEYAKGQRAPKAVLTTDRTDGPAPLTVDFSSAGSLDEDPGESIRYEWDFGDGSPISERGQPDAHLHAARAASRPVLTVIDSSGKRTSTSTADHGRQHRADGRGQRCRSRAALFAFGDKIPYAVTVTDPEDGDGQLQGHHGDVRPRP